MSKRRKEIENIEPHNPKDNAGTIEQLETLLQQVEIAEKAIKNLKTGLNKECIKLKARENPSWDFLTAKEPANKKK